MPCPVRKTTSEVKQEPLRERGYVRRNEPGGTGVAPSNRHHRLACLVLVFLVGACIHGPDRRARAAENDGRQPADQDSAPTNPGQPATQANSPDTPGESAQAKQDELVERIIRILSARQDKNDVGPLVPALELDMPRVQLYVLGEFARLGPAVAEYDQQVIGLLDQPDEQVRAAAVAALGKMGKATGVDPLVRALTGDPSMSVRAAAARSIGELSAVLREPGEDFLTQVAQQLVGALADPSPQVRQAVAVGLGQLGWGGAGRTLADVLATDPDAAVRGLAAHALGQLGSAQWVEALQEALAHDASPSVRLYAADALGNIGSRRALDGLVAALDDEEVRVQEAAVLALRQIADPRAIPPLEQLLSRGRSENGSPLADRTWQTLLKLADDRAVLWDLAVKRYLVGDKEQAREAAQLVVERFADVEGAVEVREARLLQALAASDGPNGEQAEPLLRQALATVDSGELTEEQLTGLQALLGLDMPVKRKLLEQLDNILRANGRTLERLEVLDQLAQAYPETQEDLWKERYRALLDCASEGDWGTVDLYLESVAEQGADFGGVYHDRLVVLAGEVRAALGQMSPGGLVRLWLHSSARVAGHLEPRLRTQDPATMEVLIDALASPEAQSRRRAVGLLRKVTGQNFGFDPDAAEEQRTEALTRWRDWFTGTKEETPAAQQPAATPPGQSAGAE